MWWRREKKEVSEFLYRLLVSEAPSKGFARQVAERMGVPYPTLSKYWLGKVRFPAALVGPLFLATDQDVRVAEFFVLQGSGYRLERAGDRDAAIELFRRAAGRTASIPERNYLLEKAARLAWLSPSPGA